MRSTTTFPTSRPLLPLIRTTDLSSKTKSISLYQELEQQLIRPISLYLEGPWRTGKTAWARSLGRHNYFSSRRSFKDYDKDAVYNVIDDIKYLTVSTELTKKLVECQRLLRIR